MKIDKFIWFSNVVDKLTFKHHVDTREVEEVFDAKPKIRFAGRGDRKGEDVYMALGQSQSGRYLAVIFIRKKNNGALILSARDMANKERKQYGRK
jgi:uncharacterized DUF497 family protein